jgi:hypothetical protein
MLTLSPAVRVFIAAEPIDLHLSFDRLAGLVRHHLLADPLLCCELQYVAWAQFVLRFLGHLSMWRPAGPPHIVQTFSSSWSTASVG